MRFVTSRTLDTGAIKFLFSQKSSVTLSQFLRHHRILLFVFGCRHRIPSKLAYFSVVLVHKITNAALSTRLHVISPALGLLNFHRLLLFQCYMRPFQDPRRNVQCLIIPKYWELDLQKVNKDPD